MYRITFLKMLIRKLINRIIKKNLKSIYFIPHPNCEIDKYDIINYSADNVLTFFNYLLRHPDMSGFTFYIEIFAINKIRYYEEYCRSINPNIKVVFLCNMDRNRIWRFINKARNFINQAKCYMCFTDTIYYDFRFKLKKQVYICLNYFIPFKDDYYRDLKRKNLFDSSFDYCLSTSKWASQINALSSKISYFKFINLGFPRNDNLFKNDKKVQIYDFLSAKVSYNVEKIILYTPTFRDYDLTQTQTKRNILGYDYDSNELTSLLREYKAVIVVKLHPVQNIDSFTSILPSEIVLLKPNEEFNLYDFLANTDIFITDYTSTYFDFLLLNRPIIFNFYDKEKYSETRGFSYDPIENICAGEIVKTWEEFIAAIKSSLEGLDNYQEKREYITSFMHKNIDFAASKRIYEYFFDDKMREAN